MELNFVGNWFDSSGYSAHLRGLARATAKLADVGVECAKPHLWERMVDAEGLALLQKSYPKGKQVLITTPEFSVLKHAERNEGLYQWCIFEGDRVPAFWGRILNKPYVKRVLVPSKHVYDALINTPGFDSGFSQHDNVVGNPACPHLQAGDVVRKEDMVGKVRIVPHGVDLEVFKPLDRDALLLKKDWAALKDKFVFGFVGGWAQGVNDRKDLATALRAYSEEFRNDERIALLVKINAAYNPGMDIPGMIESLGLPKGGPPLMLVTNDLTEAQLAEVYSLMDVHCMPTRGEAFGMTMLEAMSCGAVNIATNWSGHLDFLNVANSVLVDGVLKPSQDASKLYEGVSWCFTEVADWRKAMRKLYEDRVLLKKLRTQGLEDAKKWSWQNSAQKLLSALD